MIFNGKGHWCKVLSPVLKYNSKTEYEWAFDLEVDDDIVQVLKEKKVRNRPKQKDGIEGKVITFRRDCKKKDGGDAKPFEIVDRFGEPWPKDKLIGNGSELNVSVAFNERTGPDGAQFHKMSAIKIQVWDHVPYEGEEFDEFPVAEKTGEEDWSDE